MEAFSHSVPVPNELDQQPDVKCELSELQYIAVHDPVLIAPREDPSSARESEALTVSHVIQYLFYTAAADQPAPQAYCKYSRSHHKL